MEALGMETSNWVAGLRCSGLVHGRDVLFSASRPTSVRTGNACCLRTSLNNRKFLTVRCGENGSSPDIDYSGKIQIASEKAVEGVSEQLHETARAQVPADNYKDDGEKVKKAEAAADVASEEAAAEAAADVPTDEPAAVDSLKPSGASQQSANVGDGHEEGSKAAQTMTPHNK
ncbi:hypothetical protein KP509_31G003500 [Ceratopteris richardii]|uniref:Uncharacterized protein n=1 Tax=Ceratopteris richardii TaxID=49495 RepID=A0A8T2QWP5_CERRI|nr:hypothetical protein KP509_31G003500 [Ceratopteris richardii]